MPRPRPRPLALAILALAAAALAACGNDGGTAPPAPSAPPVVVDGAGTPVSTPPAQTGTAPVAGPPSVADLMARAGCKGQLIAPQQYTREVGRCVIGGNEVDVAVFDTNDQRDQWAHLIHEGGATTATGELWAVAGIGEAGPEAFVAVVG